MRLVPLPRLAVSIIVAVLATIALAPTATAGTTPVNGKYVSYAYAAASRQGSAVYVNGLVKQDYSTGIIRSPRRTVYLQRNINGGWQTMLSRVTSWDGRVTVGYISVVAYQYRWVVAPSGGAWGTTSGGATPPGDQMLYAHMTNISCVMTGADTFTMSFTLVRTGASSVRLNNYKGGGNFYMSSLTLNGVTYAINQDFSSSCGQ